MEERKLPPVSFDHITDPAPWGSENWLVADLGYRDSVAKGGWLEGNSLSELMETYLERMVGDELYDWYGRQFPLLLKEIHATEEGPLMVSPNDSIAEERYDSLGKTKLWYVLDAAPGSVIYYGLRRDLTATEFYEACSSGVLRDAMMPFRVEKGDYVLISPGELHGLGRGVKVVEVAESSAMDMMVSGSDDSDPAEVLDFVNLKGGCSGRVVRSQHPRANDRSEVSGPAERLAECEQFIVGKISLNNALRISNEGEGGYCILYYCVSGGFSVQVPCRDGRVDSLTAKVGDAILLPAEQKSFDLIPMSAGTVLLEAMAKERVREDGYINPDAEPTIDG